MDLSDFVREALLAEHEAIETEVEKALQAGHCGVKVTRNRWGRLVSAAVDSEVPYGLIHEHWIKEER